MLNELNDIGLYNSNVTEFSFGNVIQNVKRDSFHNCYKLKRINIPMAQYIESDTFGGCHGIESISLPPITQFTQNIFGSDKPSALTGIIFNEGTKDIGTVLQNLSTLTSIRFPDSLATIQTGAFYGCSNIGNLEFGRNVYLQQNSFAGIDSLLSITVPLSNDTPDLGFKTLPNLESVKFLRCGYQKLTLINDVVSDCKARSIEFENYGHEIDWFSDTYFKNCINLEEINISNSSIQTIGKDLFSNCSSLTYIHLPDSVKVLYSNCFKDTNLKYIHLPPSLNYIENTGINLHVDRIPESINKIGSSTFKNSTLDDANVNLPNFRNELNTFTFSNSNISSIDINLQSSGGRIQKGAFSNCKNLEHVGFYDSTITTVEESAFYGCERLTDNGIFENLEIAKEFSFYGTYVTDLSSTKLREIGSYAFAKTKLQKVFMNNVLFNRELSSSKRDPANLGKAVFYRCDEIEKIDASDTKVETLNEISDFFDCQMVIDYEHYEQSISTMYNAIKGAFGIDDSLNSFTMYLADGIIITKDGEKTDYDCLIYEDYPINTIILSCDVTKSDFNLFVSRGATIPSKVRKIKEGAFNRAKQYLKTFNFQNVEEIPNDMFANSNIIERVSSRNNCTKKIGNGAFYGCRNLTRTPSFSNVSSFGDNAFYGCTGLDGIYFGDELKTIGDMAFMNCRSLDSIRLRDNVDHIGLSSFCNCYGAKELELYYNNPVEKTISADTFSGCRKILTTKLKSNVKITNNSFRGMSGLSSLTMDDMTEDQCCDTFQIDKTTLIGDNIFGLANGLQVLTKFNDYKYPFYIVCGSRIKGLRNCGMKVQLDDRYNINVELVGFDVNYYHLPTLLSSDFTNIDTIKTNAFNSVNTIQTIYMPTELFDNIEYAAFSQMENLDIMYVDKEYDNKYENYINHLTGNKESNLRIAFRDGILTKDGFIKDDGIFKSKNRIIIGVIKTNKQRDVTIGNQYIEISSYAFEDDVTISSLNTGNIVKIHDNAFYNNTGVSKIVLGDGIKNVGRHSFTRSSVKEITIPGVVNVVGNYGLSESKKLHTINYCEGITQIGPSAMIDCEPAVTALNFPHTLLRIGEYAYAEPYDLFPRLDNVNFKNLENLSVIDSFAFYNSVHTLENRTLSLRHSQLSIMDYAFAYNKYTYIQLLNDLCFSYPTDLDLGARYIGRAAFEYNHFRRLGFGNSIDVIDAYAFAYPKYKYENTLFPYSLKSIGRNAFKDNIVLNPERTDKNLFFFDNVISATLSIFNVKMNEWYEAENVGGFTDTTCLSGLSTDFYSGFAYIYDNKMNYCPDGVKIDIFKKIIVQGKQDAIDIVIPKYIKTIGKGAFMNISSLVSVSALQGLNIEESAFYGCINFERFNEYGSNYYLLSCSDYAFYQCNKLSSLRLLSSVPSIGRYTFAGCKNIKKFYDDIDGEYFRYYSLSAINDGAFQSCDTLYRFDICRNLSALGNGTFDYCPSLNDINIDIDSKEFNRRIDPTLEISALIRYKFLNIRKDYRCFINFTDVSYTNDGVVKMDNEFVETYEYSGNKIGIRKVKYDLFVEKDRSYLNLSAISKIDQFVFCNIQGLNNISFMKNNQTGYGLEEIGDYCFCNCNNLYNVNAGRLDCHTVGEYAFANCNSLTSLCFDHSKISNIKRGAFYGSGITELIFGGFEDVVHLADYEKEIKEKIGYSTLNKNPLALPTYCNIIFKDRTGSIIGKYTYIFVDILNLDIDINRNQQFFIDKTNKSIQPVQIVKASDSDKFPIIINNTFHANIVGRWK